MADASYHSPARSVGEPSSLGESENESEHCDLATEVPGTPDQTIIDGWLKFRDSKKVSIQFDQEIKLANSFVNISFSPLLRRSKTNLF